MKSPLRRLACLPLLLLPWLALYCWYSAAQTGKSCVAQVEVLDLIDRGAPVHTTGLLTYHFESNDRALLRFAGELKISGKQSEHSYKINRTAEVALAIVGDHVKTTTLGASRSFADDAPDELVYRYAHPSLQTGSYYHARLYRITSDLIATGTDLAPRNLCNIAPSS